nr:MAG TPA: hypothetical protein [Bacteriophage sp.]
MRVISQDGTLDFPYELSTVRVYNEIISMGMCKDDSCRSIIARYSTEEKALKAMEMLREQHEKVTFLKTIINTEKGTQFIRSLSETTFDKMTQNYFQFPKDDEVEV